MSKEEEKEMNLQEQENKELYSEELLNDYQNWAKDTAWKDKVENQELLGDWFVVEVYIYWPPASNIITLEGEQFQDPVLTSHAKVLLMGNDVPESHQSLRPGDIVKVPDWLALGSIRNYEYDLANSLDQERGTEIRMDNRPAQPMVPAIHKLKQNIYVPDILKNELDKYDAYTFRLGSEYVLSKVTV